MIGFAVLAMIFLEGFTHILEGKLADAETNWHPDGGLCVIADFHRPATDIADIANARHIECQIAVERAMACGMGTCQSCVVPIRDETVPARWRYALCCTEGPVFDVRQLLLA